MSAVPTDPIQTVRVDIACKCHEQARVNQAHVAPGTELGCHGALQIMFPVRMFDGAGELEYRQTRQRWVNDTLAMFDDFYERIRMDLTQKEPLVIRPQRKGRMLALFDAEDMKAASEGNGQDGDAVVMDSLASVPDTNEC